MAKSAAHPLADRLIAELAVCRDGDESYPPSLRRLLARLDPPPDPDAADDGVTAKSFTSRAVLAVTGHPDAPVALAEDAERLVASPQTVEAALIKSGAVSAETARPVGDLAKAVDKRLQKGFKETLTRQLKDEAVPEFVGTAKHGKKLGLYHKTPPPPPPADPRVEAANRLIAELTAARDRGGDGYPTRLNIVIARLDPIPDVAAVNLAVASRSFTGRAIMAVRDRPDTPVVLAADLGALAASPLTLEAALLSLGAKGTPPWTPAELATAVDPALKKAFEASVKQRQAAGTLPAFVGTATKGTGKKATSGLYHTGNPPPLSLPQRLIELLRAHGTSAGLMTLEDLQRESGATDKEFKAAVKDPGFLGASIQTKCGSSGTIVLLREQFDRLVADPPLDQLLSNYTRAGAQAFSAADVAGTLDEPKKGLMTAHLNRLDLIDHLPVGCGFVETKAGKGGQRLFFRLQDVQTGRAGGAPPSPEVPAVPVPPLAPTPPAAAVPPDFVTAFDEAFARLDRLHGSNNFVSLVDLRAAFPDVPREVFDAHLRQFRRDRRYDIKSAERYNSFSPEQRAAAILEAGEYLLHVYREHQ